MKKLCSKRILYNGWDPKKLKAKLETLHHKDKLSISMMAKQLNASAPGVHKWCVKLGVKVRTREEAQSVRFQREGRSTKHVKNGRSAKKTYSVASAKKIPKGYIKEVRRVTLRLPRHLAIQFCGGF